MPVITMDNLVVGIDTVIYFQVTDARAATYEVANYITAVEQLTVTTLRNVVGGMELEHALTSRDRINSELRAELDEATGKWGIRVGRVELKAIEPPGSIQDSMEKQMRADRDKRAAILSAEGSKQSAILTAEGERQSAVLKARGESEAAVLRAEADARAGRGDRHRVPCHPRRPPRPAAAGLPVHADAAADRPGRREQGLDRAERDRQGAGGPGRLLQRCQQPVRVASGAGTAAGAGRPRSYRPADRVRRDLGAVRAGVAARHVRQW